ncbi:flagellin [Ectothiorhodospira haloalkaliphila]
MEAIANAIRTAIANDAGLNEEDYEVSSNATDQTVSITNLSEANVSVVSSLRTDSGNIVSETGGEAKAAEITATSDVGVLGNPGTGNYTVSNFSFTMGGSTVDLTDAVSGTYVTDADLAEALNSAITQQPEFAGIQGIDATDFGFSVTGGTDVQFTNTTLEAVNISLSVDGTGDGDSVSDQTISAGTLDTSGATDSVDTTGAFDISLGSTGTINITGVGEFEFSVERGSTLTTLANAIEDTIRTQAGNEDIAVTVDGDKLVFTNSGFTDFNFDLDLEDGANAALFDDTLQGAVVQDLNQYFGSGETVNFEVSLGEEKFVINDARSLTDVAGAINARSSDTGIRANVSSDGRDINFSTDRGGEFEVTLKADVGGTGEFEVNTAVSANAADNSSFVDGFGVDTLDRANETLLVADYAIQQVNSLRADMGSIQNRLEATISNLTVGSENLSGARSRIVDADFASETAALTRAQILQQAGTSVLAQANQAPQNVLALLQ